LRSLKRRYRVNPISVSTFPGYALKRSVRAHTRSNDDLPAPPRRIQVGVMRRTIAAPIADGIGVQAVSDIRVVVGSVVVDIVAMGIALSGEGAGRAEQRHKQSDHDGSASFRHVALPVLAASRAQSRTMPRSPPQRNGSGPITTGWICGAGSAWIPPVAWGKRCRQQGGRCPPNVRRRKFAAFKPNRSLN